MQFLVVIRSYWDMEHRIDIGITLPKKVRLFFANGPFLPKRDVLMGVFHILMMTLPALKGGYRRSVRYGFYAGLIPLQTNF